MRLVQMLIRTILRKRRHIWPVLYNMAREEVGRSLNFMLKVLVADATGEVLVTAVAEEEVATSDEEEEAEEAEEVEEAEEAEVYLGVVAAGERNLILPPFHTLTRSG